MAQVDEKTKEKIQKQINALALQIKKAGEYADRARIELERLKEELEEYNKKKPFLYATNGTPYEINMYRKYSHTDIEFRICGDSDIYRYIVEVTEPCYPHTLEHRFEKQVFSGRPGEYRWEKQHWIERIELLEGVNDYDKA